MANQDVNIRLIGDDKASGPIRNVQGALGNLERSTGSASGAFGALGQAASVAAGFIVAQIGTQAVSAVANLAKEMVTLTNEAAKFKAQTANILQNMGLQKFGPEIDKTISKLEELTAVGDTDLQDAFNNMVMVSGDVTEAFELVQLAADIATAKNIDMTTSSKLVMQALNGDVGMLKRYGIYLDENAMKTMTATQKYQHFKETIESTMGGAAEAFRNSSAGIFQNFNNQIENLKKAFGEGLVGAIAPALEGVSDKIYELLSSGSLDPLIKSFGNLASKVIDVGTELGKLVINLMNASNEEEAINKIADAFDRLSWILNGVESVLARINVLVKDLHLDQVMNFMGAAADQTLFGGMWGRAGQQVQYANAGQYTENEAIRRGLITPEKQAIDDNTRATEQQTTYTEEQINAMKANIRTIAESTFTEIGYNYTTKETSNSIAKFGDVAAAGTSKIMSALSGSGGGSGAGGSGCRTFQTGTSVSGGGSFKSGAYSGGASGSPGMLWYNVLGNENASKVVTMGEQWASTVSSITYNGCSGLVCSFDTVEQTQINGSNATINSKFYNDNGSFVQTEREVTYANDALITKRGDIVKFHPDDNIMAYKGNAPRGNLSVNITVNGSGDPDKVAELIMRKIERIQRM